MDQRTAPAVFEPEMTALGNGLRVISLRLPGASTVGVVMAVDAGGADEPDELCGISHFLDHLMFRATEHYENSPALGAAIEGVGGYFNAFTSKTITAYLAAAPREHLELAASIPAELVIRSLLRGSDIEDERPIVLREISMYEDRASSRALQALQGLVWRGSGYSRPILGYPATLAACTEEPVQRYWRAHYRPERAIFALAGDLDHALAEQLARQLAGSWPAPNGGASMDGAPPASADTERGARLRVEQMDRQRVELQVGCRTPAFPRANRAEQEALASLAGGGKGSRLNRVLLQERGLLLQASAFNWLHRGDGMLAVAASAQPDRAMEAAQALVDELVSLKDATEHECLRAINFTRGEYARSLAEPLGSATRVAEEALWVADVPSRAADKAAFENLTPDGLRAAAGHFFTRESLAMAVVGPGVDYAAYERCLG